MALPTSTELLSLDFVFEGQPYVGQTLSGTDVNTMDFVFEGRPFVVTQVTSGAAPKQKAKILSFIWGI